MTFEYVRLLVDWYIFPVETTFCITHADDVRIYCLSWRGLWVFNKDEENKVFELFQHKYSENVCGG